MRRAFDWLLDRLPAWLDPRRGPVIRVDGTRLVLLHSEGAVDLDGLRTAALRAVVEFRESIGAPPSSRLRLRCLRDIGRTPDESRVRQGLYYPARKMIHLRLGYEHVLRHELFHAWAHAMGLPGWKTIDHPGGVQV